VNDNAAGSVCPDWDRVVLHQSDEKLQNCLLKKVPVFKRFSLFFAVKTSVYSAFFPRFFPTASRYVKIIA
jgi:hypothetical protein